MIKNGTYDIDDMYVGDETVVKVYLGDEEVWPIDPGIVNYITFTAMEDNCYFRLSRLSSHQTIEYKTKGNRWRNFQEDDSIYLSHSGDCVYIRGMLSDDNDENNYTSFDSYSGKIKISGNINYFWNKDNPNAPLKKYCGKDLFNNCHHISDISELEFPSEELSEGCYYMMFSFCSLLVNTPELPATALTNNCYGGMFAGCTSLVEAPELPATVLAEGCYYEMFIWCSRLITAPELPSTILDKACYKNMFYGCTSLVNAPELPATTLAENCYLNMFRDCSNLKQIKCLATNISATSCTFTWVNGVSSNGTFICPNSMRSAWDAKSNYSGKPDGWVYQDA